MARVVTMLQSDVTGYTEIIIGAGGACDEVCFIEDYRYQQEKLNRLKQALPETQQLQVR